MQNLIFLVGQLLNIIYWYIHMGISSMVVGKIMEINCDWISYCHIRVCTRTYICSGFLRFPTGPSGTNKPLWEILEVERVKHIPLSWCKFGKYMRQMLGIWGLNHVKSPMICGGFSTHAFFLGWSSSFLRLHAINFTRNPKDCNFLMRKKHLPNARYRYLAFESFCHYEGHRFQVFFSHCHRLNLNKFIAPFSLGDPIFDRRS